MNSSIASEMQGGRAARGHHSKRSLCVQVQRALSPEGHTATEAAVRALQNHHQRQQQQQHKKRQQLDSLGSAARVHIRCCGFFVRVSCSKTGEPTCWLALARSPRRKGLTRMLSLAPSCPLARTHGAPFGPRAVGEGSAVVVYICTQAKAKYR
ncbi:adenylosuccinate lyase [Anopheles sinensis]|uniref:Adenylosuccinate lyase n=1 Tax=Anopheles sinensis TaxID=74873 RepID=A0A084VP16_ANOSI|nr:adenylosuccinate lyase [Anopheles sinensis]